MLTAITISIATGIARLCHIGHGCLKFSVLSFDSGGKAM